MDYIRGVNCEERKQHLCGECCHYGEGCMLGYPEYYVEFFPEQETNHAFKAYWQSLVGPAKLGIHPCSHQGCPNHDKEVCAHLSDERYMSLGYYSKYVDDLIKSTVCVLSENTPISERFSQYMFKESGLELHMPLLDWMYRHFNCNDEREIPPQGNAEIVNFRLLGDVIMIDGQMWGEPANEFEHIDQGKVLIRLNQLGFTGTVFLPRENYECIELLKQINLRVEYIHAKFNNSLAAQLGYIDLLAMLSRAPSEHAQLVDELTRQCLKGEKSVRDE